MGATDGKGGQSGNPSGGGSVFSVKTLVTVVLLGVICYQVYLGVHLSEIGIPGVFTVKFQQASGQRSADVDQPEPTRDGSVRTAEAPDVRSAPERETGSTANERMPEPPPPPISRDFFVGRWAVHENGATLGAGTLVDYFADGTFAGTVVYFDGIGWRRDSALGVWQFVPMDERRFAIAWQRANGEVGNETFVVMDDRRIRNIYGDYVAVRVP